MTILRLFIKDENLNEVNWQTVENIEVADYGQAPLSDLVQMEFDNIEIYLAPYLTTILKVELGAISDKKINDELLLNLVEEHLAEDIENCKPILMRLNDGIDYAAILNRSFYQELLAKLSNNIKQVKFIQPFPYITHLEPDTWTIYLIGADKFIRTSQYEYYILDDKEPIPEVLEQLLTGYVQDSIVLYAEDENVGKILNQKYKLNCKLYAELDYGLLNWNLYNEKSKRFDIKLHKDTQNHLVKSGKMLGIYVVIFAVFWVMNLFYMVYEKHKLQNQISMDLQGITASANFGPNLLSQVDDKLLAMEHDKGFYAPSDMISLFDVFLKSMPDVNNDMIEGVQYSGSQLNIFLSNDFNPSKFGNDQAILLTKRIKADIQDYKTYQAAQNKSNSQNNNGGGVLSNTDVNSNSSSSASLQDSAWVITLQLISRMDSLNDSSSSK